MDLAINHPFIRQTNINLDTTPVSPFYWRSFSTLSTMLNSGSQALPLTPCNLGGTTRDPRDIQMSLKFLWQSA